MSYSEVVKTVYLDPISLLEDNIKFKIEILSKDGFFSALIFRIESYTVKPSFINASSGLNDADEMFSVLDYHTFPNIDAERFNTIDECLESVISKIKERFAH